jgi:hypothetical protein
LLHPDAATVGQNERGDIEGVPLGVLARHGAPVQWGKAAGSPLTAFCLKGSGGLRCARQEAGRPRFIARISPRIG